MGRKKSPKDEPKKDDSASGGTEEVTSYIISSNWLILFVLLLAGIVWFGFYATHTKEIAGSDDREYTSIARNIVNGKGIVRNFVYPVDINFFEKLPIPEFIHPPGYPLILAGFFKLFGISDFVCSYFLPISPILFSSFFFSFLSKDIWRLKQQS